MARFPQRQRVAAYAVVLRDEQILLSRLAPRIAGGELWALPGGGLDHGEDPARAVVREIYEETGLHAAVSRQSRVYSMHNPRAQHGDGGADYHALRIVFEGWVPVDAPTPRVVEVDGSTIAAAWHPLDDVRSGKVPVTDLVHQALRGHEPFQMQRLAAYALARARRTGPADPDLGPWPPPGGVDAARRRDRPRRGAGRRAGPRGARGVRRRRRGRAAARHPRRALLRHRAVGSARGLPRGAPGLRGHGAGRRRAARGGGRRHHRCRGLGAGRRDRAATSSTSSTWSGTHSPSEPRLRWVP